MWFCNDCSVDFASPLMFEVVDAVFHSVSCVFCCPVCGSAEIEKYEMEVH